MIPRGSLDGLTAEDLRLLLNGVGDINVQTLISYTSFNDESGEGGEKVQRFKRWFWSIVEKMNNVERQDLVSTTKKLVATNGEINLYLCCVIISGISK